MSHRRMNRRTFLQTSAGAGALLAGAGRSRGATSTGRARRGPARNVILLVSDGMSTGTLTLADVVRRKREGVGSHWVRLWDRPDVHRGMMETRAADSEVTDSAAASSAWSVGERVNNGAICVTPDGRRPTPLLVRASAKGLATGLVTTTRVTHATPAAFVANVPERDMEDEIARQMVERGVDVTLGGGAKHFPEELLAQSGVNVIRTADELSRATHNGSSGRLLGLFNRSHMRYELDRPASEPTLAAMTRAALHALQHRTEGFVVQIEGGRVDHAAHANDAGSLIADQLAFDDAIGTVLEFVEGRDDTLVIVTTDHGNANPGLTLYGEPGNEGLMKASRARKSFEWIQERIGRGGRSLPSLVEEASGVSLTAEQRELLEAGVVRGERVDPFGEANKPGPVIGSVLANHFGIAFVSPNHTSDHVEITAFGPGAEAIRGLVPNTALHDVCSEALKLPAN